MIDFFKRLDKYMEIKNLNDNKLTIEAKVSNGLIGKARKRGSLSLDNISKILYTCSDLDANWLLTGNGEMLKNDTGNIKARLLKSTNPVEIDNILNETIHIQNITIKDLIAEKNELKKKVHQLEQELKEMQ